MIKCAAFQSISMKLYLSSQLLGNPTDKLLELVGENIHGVVVANAIDDKPKTCRANRVRKEIRLLGEIGLQAEELDLRDYSRNSNELGKTLESKSLVWVRGGNSFILRRAMAQSGFDESGVSLIQDSRLVYGGYSAALIVTSMDLLGAEMVDDPSVVPERYEAVDPPTTGLGLLDFHIIPHYGSTEAWAANVSAHMNYLIANQRTVLHLRDGEVYTYNSEATRASL